MSFDAKPNLALSLHWGTKQFPHHKPHLPRHKIMRWIKLALASSAEITVRFVDAKEGQALNDQFRGKNHATNVLTFPYESKPLVMADFVLCAPVIEQEAIEQGKPLQAHYAHMLLHATLHAQGWDHIKASEAKKMEAYETQLMQKLGFANPYS